MSDKRRRRLLKSPLVLVVVLVVGAAMTGLAWAHWSDTLEVQGQVETGTMEMVITSAATDDDGVSNPFEIIKETAAVEGTLLDMHPGTSSDDPGAYRAAFRYDKDVAICRVIEPSPPPPGKLVTFEALNTYPSYHCTIQGQIRVDGSVPMKNQAAKVWACGPNTDCASFPTNWTQLEYFETDDVFRYDGPDGDPEWELEMQDAPGGRCGYQFDPGDTSVWTVGFHVLQDAEQNASYELLIQLELVNWNEWDIEACEGFDQFEP